MDIFEEYRLKGLQEGLKQVAKRMYRKGFKIENIADTIGVDIDTVKNWLKEKNLS